MKINLHIISIIIKNFRGGKSVFQPLLSYRVNMINMASGNNIRCRCFGLLVLLLISFSDPVLSAAKNDLTEPVGNTSAYGRDIQSMFSEILQNTLPKEKVYLHLDNTSYYQDDTLWFAAYLVNADGNTSDAMSGTLYVDLLNPGGDVIDTRVLRLKNGRAYGNFKINCTPFYSGFFEIRAYTKYMMNFGAETAYSRVIPVFDKPGKEGEYQKRNMRAFGAGQYQYKRKYPEKGKDYNVRFYPEGGRLVKGIPSRIAFEASDKTGHPIAAEGIVVSQAGDTIASFRTVHEGKGVFTVVPDGSQMRAVVKFEGKTRKVEMPEIAPEGYAISVDNISNPDSIIVTINRAGIYNRIDTLGVALTNHGILKVYKGVASTFRKPVCVAFNKKDLAPGVGEATLVDIYGRKIAERLFFSVPDTTDMLDMKYEFDKKEYLPYEPVNLSISISDKVGNGVRIPFSLSVRDMENEIDWQRNIMTDLLLMSDINGYVSRPEYYFEANDSIHRRNLDLLMLVQGWRKYPWESLSTEWFDNLRFRQETDGIEIAGTVKSLSNKKMQDVDVTAFLMKKDVENPEAIPNMQMTTTDSVGRFSFMTDVEDRVTLIINTMRKNKLIHSQVAIDKEYIPAPRRYRIYETEVQSAPVKNSADSIENGIGREQSDSIIPDELKAEIGSDDKSVWLKELEVKSKRNWRDNDRDQAKRLSVAYYDVDTEVNAMRDNGDYIDLGEDINHLLLKKNPEFTTCYIGSEQILLYKYKFPIIVVDYERLQAPTVEELCKYKNVRLEAIKSITITENDYMKRRYCWPQIDVDSLHRYFSCVVMIETDPEGKIMIDGGKGIRKTRFHGYDTPQEFYSPDYSAMPHEKDYRRTLYWNPDLVPDEDGNVVVTFYNNSNCREFKVDMQTVTPTGAVGSSR